VDRRTWLRASAIDQLSRVPIWPEARSDETLGGSGLTTRPRIVPHPLGRSGNIARRHFVAGDLDESVAARHRFEFLKDNSRSRDNSQ
jgi:hypothetical protein